MHLVDLGNLSNATSTITSIFSSIDRIKRSNFDAVVNRLTNGLQNYSLECVNLAVNEMNLSTIQRKAIFTAKGLTGAELEAAVAATTLSASQQTATATTCGLSTAFKGLWVTMKAHPIMTLIGVVTVATSSSKCNKTTE